MKIEIWSLGKSNDPYIETGIQQYFKKIKPYCAISLEIIAVKKSLSDVQEQKQVEEQLIFKRLQSDHFLVLLDERGKMLSSPKLAQLIQDKMNHSVKTLVFLIGGAFGVTENVRQRANYIWSISELVFPHQLMRLLLAEQIYRAFSILHNSPYHHE